MSGQKTNSPWRWVPSLYVAEGLPYALVTGVSLVLYSNLGVSNTATAFWSALLGLPWIFKPLWGPLVDLFQTRRLWVWATQLFMGAALAGVALALPLPHFFQITLALFWLLAFASATHDIAADGFYMLALESGDQALYSGVRNTFYRVANIAAQGGLVIFAGQMQSLTGSYATAWLLAFVLAAGTVFLLAVYHWRALPRPAADAASAQREKTFPANFAETFRAFFQKPKIVTLLAFVLLFRFGEAQLLPVAKLFLLDRQANGGLALTNEQFGLIYGTIGVGALLAGGLLGGYVVSRRGLKFWLWPMLLAIHLPDAVFIWLAYVQPAHLPAIGAGVALEQFGYGFGFTAFMLYLIHIARGPHATAHYALCTGFMALGLTLPGMWSGWLQEHIGYRHFFVWVIFATIPSFLVALKIPLEADFGKKSHA
jgi:PAT family beta-lactamase induction signal transducer AmpG